MLQQNHSFEKMVPLHIVLTLEENNLGRGV